MHDTAGLATACWTASSWTRTASWVKAAAHQKWTTKPSAGVTTSQAAAPRPRSSPLPPPFPSRNLPLLEARRLLVPCPASWHAPRHPADAPRRLQQALSLQRFDDAWGACHALGSPATWVQLAEAAMKQLDVALATGTCPHGCFFWRAAEVAKQEAPPGAWPAP